jgi:plastocyanin
MWLRSVLVAVAASLVLLAASTAGAATQRMLIGTDGPGFTITLTYKGKAAKKLTPGAYTLVVRDKASIHNFHLVGPGVNKTVTSVPFMGTKTVKVVLKKGKYTYQCDPHAAAGMKGTFTVG